MLVLLLLAGLAAASPEACAALCCRTAGCAAVPGEVRRRAVCYYDHCLVTRPRYTRYSVPGREDSANPHLVDLHIGVNSVTDVRMEEKEVESLVTVRLGWEDPGLAVCDCHRQGGQARPFLMAADVEAVIWVPDLVVWGGSFEREEGLVKKEAARVALKEVGSMAKGVEGGVAVVPMVRVELEVDLLVTTACQFNASYYPYDVNTCLVRFGSYGYAKEELVLVLASVTVDREDFQSGDFAMEVGPLGEEDTVMQQEEFVTSIAGFSLRILRNAGRVKQQYTGTMRWIVMFAVGSLFVSTMEARADFYIDRNGFLSAAILSSVLLFQYCVRYSPTRDRLLLTPIILYLSLCLAVVAAAFLAYILVSCDALVLLLHDAAAAFLRALRRSPVHQVARCAEARRAALLNTKLVIDLVSALVLFVLYVTVGGEVWRAAEELGAD